MSTKIELVKQEITQVVKGKDEIIDKVLCAILAGGHILLEDIPGVGKTTLAMAVSKSMSLNYKRIQFTPDVLPSDITGFSMYNSVTKEFEFKEGAVFCNLFLADEINRTSPKTQSALLEVMEEGRVSVDGVTRTLPQPFIVIATQNPVGSAGTQQLPESQLDRFLIRLSIGYPEHLNAIEILKGNSLDKLKDLSPIFGMNELAELRSQVNQVFVHDCIFDYITTLTEKTREPQIFSLGLSPRGSIALLKMAKAHAFMNHCSYVIPEDVTSVLPDVACHRIILNGKSRSQGLTPLMALQSIVSNVPIPRT